MSDYTASIDFSGDPKQLAAECGSCGWTGKAADTKEIGECSLTPGDQSPAGRCPACDSLAYINTLSTRASDNAGALLDTVKVLLGRALGIDSPSAAELMQAKALVEKIEGTPFVVEQQA